jgi:hypothetical protein
MGRGNSLIAKTSALVLLVFINVAGYGQVNKTVRLTDSLLQAGNFRAAITTYEFPTEIKQLQEKAIANLKSNPKWADKYVVVQVEKGATDIPRLIDAYGLTAEEFDKMIAGFKARRLAIYSDTTPLVIIKNKGLITFKCAKKMSLFNYLVIDIKHNLILFDNLRVTKELPITGKFYAPLLLGFEAHQSEITGSSKSQTGITYFGLSVGVNQGNTKPTLCLIHGQGTIGAVEFLTITIL